MLLQSAVLVSARRCAAIAGFGGILGLAGAGALVGGTAPALAQSGELGGVILLDDVPGFVGEGEADTVIACLAGETRCVTDDGTTDDGNLLAGFRPAQWPNLRVVDDDPVLESDVQVQATAFGRILLRDGVIAETFASGPGNIIQSVTGSAEGSEGDSAVPITSPPIEWADNNFDGSAAVWISYADTGSDGVGADLDTTFTVSEPFSVPLGTTAAIDGFVFADDTAQVVLFENGNPVDTLFDFNGTQDSACAAGPVGCESGDKGVLDRDALPPGDYTLQFTARQDVGGSPFGLQYSFDVTLSPSTVADFCWTFDGGIPREKVCVSIAECDGDCQDTPDQCPIGDAKITLTSGFDGDAICDDIAQQFFDRGVTEVVEEFQFVVGFNVPATASPGSVRVATCTVGETAYVPLCRSPSSKVVNATVFNDIPLAAIETPRCVYLGGRTYC